MDRPEHSYQYSYQQRLSGLCWAQIGEERIAFSLRERSRRVKLDAEEAKRQWRKWTEDTSGVFEFSLESPWACRITTTWKDGKRQKVEDRLPEIIRTVQLLAEFKRDEKVKRQQEEARRKLEQEHRERVAQFRARMDDQRKGEASAVDMAIQAAQAWQTSNLLRCYADAMEDKVRSSGELCAEDSPVMRYLEWLRLRIHLMAPFAGAKNFHPAFLAQAVPEILPCDDG